MVHTEHKRWSSIMTSQTRLPRFVVYLLFSERTGQVYLGYTSNLRRRFRQHNAVDNAGWTRRGRPWRLLAVRIYLDRDSAQLVEQRLKQSKYDKDNWIRALPRYKEFKSRYFAKI